MWKCILSLQSHRPHLLVQFWGLFPGSIKEGRPFRFVFLPVPSGAVLFVDGRVGIRETLKTAKRGLSGPIALANPGGSLILVPALASSANIRPNGRAGLKVRHIPSHCNPRLSLSPSSCVYFPSYNRYSRINSIQLYYRCRTKFRTGLISHHHRLQLRGILSSPLHRFFRQKTTPA